MTDTSPSEAPAAAPARGSRYPTSALALVGAVLGCLVIVAFLVLVVVRPDGMTPPRTDWHEAAAQAAPEFGPELIDPRLPEGWTANFARLSTAEETLTWSIGLLSPAQGYVELVQAGPNATDDWLEAQLDEGVPSDTIDIGGISWGVIDRRGEDDPGNHAYTLFAESDAGHLVLHGTAPDEDFRTVAQAVATEARAR